MRGTEGAIDGGSELRRRGAGGSSSGSGSGGTYGEAGRGGARDNVGVSETCVSGTVKRTCLTGRAARGAYGSRRAMATQGECGGGGAGERRGGWLRGVGVGREAWGLAGRRGRRRKRERGRWRGRGQGDGGWRGGQCEAGDGKLRGALAWPGRWCVLLYCLNMGGCVRQESVADRNDLQWSINDITADGWEKFTAAIIAQSSSATEKR